MLDVRDQAVHSGATAVARQAKGEPFGMAPQKLDYQALSNFRRELRRFLAFSEAQARLHGIPPQQHQAILAIKGRPDERLTIGDLAEALQIKPNTAVELADRLVRAGLARRAEAPEDRRRILLSLTSKAEATLASLSEAHLNELRRLAPTMQALIDRLPRESGRG